MHSTLKALREETNVHYSAVDNLAEFQAWIVNGNWEKLLPVLSELGLPAQRLSPIYEHIVIELIEINQLSTARAILRNTEAISKLKDSYPDRYLHLETLLTDSSFNPSLAYPGGSKQASRQSVAKGPFVLILDLMEHVSTVEPSRLLSLIGQALQWQLSQGMIESESAFDLFLGKCYEFKDQEDDPVAHSYKIIKFPKPVKCKVATFSPNGAYLATGTDDGIIEIWDYVSGRLRKDLHYQQNENMMVMENSVTALKFNDGGTQLASGDDHGQLILWDIKTGKIIRSILTAHRQGITNIIFAPSGKLLTGSFDSTARLFGMSSGKMLKEYRGHTSWVTALVLLDDRVISGSADGTVKIWNYSTAECMSTIKLSEGAYGSNDNLRSIHSLLKVSPNRFIIGNNSEYMYEINADGKLIKSSKLDKGESELCTSSARHEFLYISKGKIINVFNHKKIITSFSVNFQVVGMCHHPKYNILAMWDANGSLDLWRN